MNRDQAKEVLLRFRSMELDGSDTEMLEALVLCQGDAELKEWFQQQKRFNSSVREALRQIAPPEKLRDDILAGARSKRRDQERTALSKGGNDTTPVLSYSFVRRHREFLALAASIALLLGGIFYWTTRSSEDRSFTGFENRMLRFAIREYRMDILTNDAKAVRQYLAKSGGPSDFPLPASLIATPVLGGAKLSWQNHPVAMICFEAPGTKHTLYLFVTDAKAIPEPPDPRPQPGKFRKLNTVKWSRDGRAFVLAGEVPETVLQDLVR